MPCLPRKVPRRHRRPTAPKRSQPSAISATPATQNEGGCHQVPRLPRETLRWMLPSAAKCRGVTGDQARPSAPPEPAQCHKCHACHDKDGVRKMVCDKVVCERWCVTKMVCERWCVKDGVWQRWCVKEGG